jgi:hypothetical protein|tara:strand:- start:14 stop:238 length:225 start_codon:yes stop_codon:yes gene_type:complete
MNWKANKMQDIIKMIQLLSETTHFLVENDFVDFDIYPRSKGHKLYSDIQKLLTKNDNELLRLWLYKDKLNPKNN